ncbi:OmpA family protein [Halomonas sp. CKK8]|uniref:OmpA family protein n=1 Tax=Halomonas sp. CKK8 TaxID=3036127 RepID=UPI002414E061|nr:OmpA family protein [Halomonas sp. CKK8]WFM72878.1 OmpA family protein [Halomonas sp. CKK8]
MANYDGMTPGEVLADASVAEFIKELGLGIAKAQKELDDNSVRQMQAFTEVQDSLGERSLLELGLMPAFYHYQHADVSVSLQLRLEVGKTDEFGFSASASLGDTRQQSASSSASESESESGTRVETREARLEYRADATGTLTVNGTQVVPAGQTPRARLGSLRDQLVGGQGIEALVYSPPDAALTITSDAPGSQVVTGARSVAFTFTTTANGLVAIRDDAATDYVLNTGTTVSTSVQGDLAAYAQHVKAQVDAAGGFTTTLHPPHQAGEPQFGVYFDTGKAEFRSADDRRSLTELARAFAATGMRVRLEGMTDRQGSAQKNLALGEARARFVRDFLMANGVGADRIELVDSRGEGRARDAGEDDGTPNQEWRATSIATPERDYYWLSLRSQGSALLDGVAPDLQGGGDGNGFVFLWQPASPDLSTFSVTVEGQAFPLDGAAVAGHAANAAEAYAHHLTAALNATGSLRANRVGHVVEVMRATDTYDVKLFSATSAQLELTGSQGLTVTQQFSRSRSRQVQSREGASTAVAIGVSVNKRESRQFNMAVTGNSQISARLASVPPPDLFVEAIHALQRERRS